MSEGLVVKGSLDVSSLGNTTILQFVKKINEDMTLTVCLSTELSIWYIIPHTFLFRHGQLLMPQHGAHIPSLSNKHNCIQTASSRRLVGALGHNQLQFLLVHSGLDGKNPDMGWMTGWQLAMTYDDLELCCRKSHCRTQQQQKNWFGLKSGSGV